MFRVANWRNNLLMEMEATLMVTYLDNGSRCYAPLELELNKILYFPLNWTLVHHPDPQFETHQIYLRFLRRLI